MSHRANPAQARTDPDSAVLDAYFTEMAKGTADRQRIAWELWNQLAPAQRLELQISSRAVSGGDIGLSALYTQSLLVLYHARRQVSPKLSM